jgi:hypothetical protein
VGDRSMLLIEYALLTGNGKYSYKVPHSGVRRQGRVNQQYVNQHIK